MSTIPTRYVRGLDGIRALAVLLVYIEHKVISNFTIGALGVDIFFCLSGFLIIGILHSKRKHIENETTTFRIELKDFWLKRARRIFPVYYLVVFTLIIFSAQFGAGKISDGLIPWYLILSPNIFIGMISKQWTSFTHLWSIGVEQHFYIVISPLLLFTPSSRHLSAISILFAISIGTMFTQYFLGADSRSIYVSSWGNFFLMAAGGFLALRLKELRSGLLDIFLCIIFFTALISIAHIPQIRSLFDPAMFRVTFSLLGLGIGITLLRAVACNQHSRLTAFLEHATLRYMGKISYGFYVYHALVPEFSQVIPGSAGMVASIFIHFLACIALSAASWHFLEQPILKMAKRKAAVQPSLNT